MTQASLPIRLFLFVFLMCPIVPVLGQNCNVDFPGSSARTFSGACGGPTVANLELGNIINMSDGDTFTFDIPIVNITGDLHIDADGGGKIIIPVGVTVNVGGNVHFHNKNGECTKANPCVFEIVVNGTANFTDDLDNELVTLVWSGTGTVVVGDKFRNNNNGCMNCGAGGCPNIQVDFSDCRDDGSGCAGGDFCTKINSCSSDVTIPVITGCPADRVVSITGLGCSQSVIWTPPTASDNCGAAPLTSSHPSGTTFPKGLTVVTYTATDAAGNTATCSFNVTVVDNTPPIILGCPTNKTVNANASCQAVVTWAEPGLTDNCSGGNLTSTHPSGTSFPKGLTVVTYTGTDAAGNTAICSFNVNVVDNTPPVITGCPANITVNANASCQAVVNWIPPTVTDNCAPGTLTPNKAPGSTFSLGITTVVYTATDAAGKMSTCSFNVIVEDKSGPTFQNCPADLVVNVNSNCAALVNWSLPMVTDNCGSFTMTSSHNPNDNFPIGKTEVKYTASDSKGNVSTCVFNVTVKNDVLPVISNCPKDIVLKGNEMQMARADWVVPTASTLCGDVTMTGSHEPGDFFPVGITKVQYKAVDEGGSTAYCYFNVVVSQMEIDIGISKVVTPDGNKINDQWILTNIEKFPNNKVVVVDRWGGLIFTGTRYNNENVVWRGTNRNGELVPTGTYFYSIFVSFGSATIEKTGFIELVR